MSQPVIIVGTGLAGTHAAKEFRKHDKETPIVFVTADDGRIYSKPMLSNAMGKGKGADDLVMQEPAALGEQLGATVRAGATVSAIDTAAHTVTVDGEVLAYSKLVLALGAEQIRVPMEGDGVADILSVNDRVEYAALRERLGDRKRVLIVGAGLIGCEFANDFAGSGIAVTLVDLAAWPLNRLMPEPAGDALSAALRGLGTTMHFGTVVKTVERAGDGYRCTLGDGAVVEVDLVLSAVGLRPRTALAQAAGLTVNRGVVVDRQLQTSAADVYAIGDCAETAGLVLPYIMPIMHAGRVLGAALAGQAASLSYPAMPVIVKTPAHPVLVSPPAPDASGEWRCEGGPTGVRATFHAADGALLGFALTGDRLADKKELQPLLPPVLA